MSESDRMDQARAVSSLLIELLRGLFIRSDDLAAKLPLAQLRVCDTLCGGRRSMSALSRELGVSLSAMTQIADRLERAGLVKRVAEGRDRRIRSLQLTDRGEKIMRRREEARARRMGDLLAHLSPRARQEVQATLEMMVDACAASNGGRAAGVKQGVASDSQP